MGSSPPPPSHCGGLHDGVLSGGPRAEGRADLGPAALWWAPGPADASVGSGLFFARRGSFYRPRLEARPFRCSPLLVAYPRADSTPTFVRYEVLGGRAHLGSGRPGPADRVLPRTFRPAPDLAFTLGVELASEMAQRLGHSASATAVWRGAPGNCRPPRIIGLVGSQPRRALQHLGQRLLEWKEFPQCTEGRNVNGSQPG